MNGINPSMMVKDAIIASLQDGPKQNTEVLKVLSDCGVTSSLGTVKADIQKLVVAGRVVSDRSNPANYSLKTQRNHPSRKNSYSGVVKLLPTATASSLLYEVSSATLPFPKEMLVCGNPCGASFHNGIGWTLWPAIKFDGLRKVSFNNHCFKEYERFGFHAGMCLRTFLEFQTFQDVEIPVRIWIRRSGEYDECKNNVGHNKYVSYTIRDRHDPEHVSDSEPTEGGFIGKDGNGDGESLISVLYKAPWLAGHIVMLKRYEDPPDGQLTLVGEFTKADVNIGTGLYSSYGITDVEKYCGVVSEERIQQANQDMLR